MVGLLLFVESIVEFIIEDIFWLSSSDWAFRTNKHISLSRSRSKRSYRSILMHSVIKYRNNSLNIIKLIYIVVIKILFAVQLNEIIN